MASDPSGINSDVSTGLTKDGAVVGEAAGNVGKITYNGDGMTNGAASNINGHTQAGSAASLVGGSSVVANKTGAYVKSQGTHKVAGVEERVIGTADATRDGTNVFANLVAELGQYAG